VTAAVSGLSNRSKHFVFTTEQIPFVNIFNPLRDCHSLASVLFCQIFELKKKKKKKLENIIMAYNVATLDELIAELHKAFESDSVDVDHVTQLMQSYTRPIRLIGGNSLNSIATGKYPILIFYLIVKMNESTKMVPSQFPTLPIQFSVEKQVINKCLLRQLYIVSQFLRTRNFTH
jgi:hypothetical protein